ncbi:MAG: hypothetical protein K2M17_04605 [Bacilli bacterium]|nr:hypothetical protein [Bacilli bacterium]
MRYHNLRFDVWLCLLLSFLLSLGTEKIVKSIYTDKYEEHKEEHIVDENEIGGVAGEDIFRAQSVEDLLSHDVFTVVSPGIQYRNRGAGYYHNFYMYALTLPSGEIVAARINGDSVVSDSDSIFSGNNTLPVGKIVEADLTDSTYFLDQIEHNEPLSRKDFYVDMVGGAEIQSEDYFVGAPAMIAQILTIVVTFPVFHAIGSKIGIFPYFFAPKKKKEEEWE